MNILPEIGLYNGAIGTVIEIVYKSRPVGPNDKEHCHLPDYVVVDFPNLKLPRDIPPWNQNHKTVSLIPYFNSYLLNLIWIFGGAVRIRTSSTNSYSIRRRVWHGYHEPIKVIWY